MESAGPEVAGGTGCLLGSGNEGGNNTKPSKDAGLGGFADSREDRGVRKTRRKHKGPEVRKNAKQIHLEGTLEQQQRLREVSIFWEGAGGALSDLIPAFPRILAR